MRRRSRPVLSRRPAPARVQHYHDAMTGCRQAVQFQVRGDTCIFTQLSRLEFRTWGREGKNPHRALCTGPAAAAGPEHANAQNGHSCAHALPAVTVRVLAASVARACSRPLLAGLCQRRPHLRRARPIRCPLPLPGALPGLAAYAGQRLTRKPGRRCRAPRREHARQRAPGRGRRGGRRRDRRRGQRDAARGASPCAPEHTRAASLRRARSP